MTVSSPSPATMPDLPDFGIHCGHGTPGSCTARFPFGGYDLLGIGYLAGSPVWTYSATVHEWRCPTHSAPAPWFPEWDGTSRPATEEEQAAMTQATAAYERPEQSDPYAEWTTQAAGAGQPSAPEDRLREAGILIGGIEDDLDADERDRVRAEAGVTFWADEVPGDDQPTGALTRVLERIRGRR